MLSTDTEEHKILKQEMCNCRIIELTDSMRLLTSSFTDTGGVNDALLTLITHPSPIFKLLYCKIC